jgi:hypothetical protein
MTLKARLHPIGKHGVYNVLFDGKLLVENSRVPELDACRALLAMGISGELTLCDGKTGKRRSIVDIEGAVKLTVEENNTTGPRFRKWRPFHVKAQQTGNGTPHSPEDEAA